MEKESVEVPLPVEAVKEKEIYELQNKIKELEEEKKALEKQLQETYQDRNQAVLLACKFALKLGIRAGHYQDPHSPDWPVISIKLSTGEVSYHIPKSDLPLWVPPTSHKWDGHDNVIKRQRVKQFLLNK